MARKLRGKKDEVPMVEAADEVIIQKIKRGLSITLELASRWKDFKNELSGMETELAELKKTVLAEVKKNKGCTILLTEGAMFETKPSIKRSVAAPAFFNWVIDSYRDEKGKLSAEDGLAAKQDAFSYVTIGVTAAIKDYGEAPLIKADVLDVRVDDYGSASFKVRKD